MKKHLLVFCILLALSLSLAGLVSVSFYKRHKTFKQLEYIAFCLKRYKEDTALLPYVQQGLTSLYQRPVLSPIPEIWNGPYMEEKGSYVPDIDMWGNFIVYYVSGENVTLLSLGADGRKGGYFSSKDIILKIKI